MDFTHFDAQGNARMVDVSEKSVTVRSATAEGLIRVSPEVFEAVERKTVKKGDVLSKRGLIDGPIEAPEDTEDTPVDTTETKAAETMERIAKTRIANSEAFSFTDSQKNK